MTKAFKFAIIFLFKFTLAASAIGFSFQARAQEKLIYHDIKVDSSGAIVPWYDPDLGRSFDHVVMSVWNFWDTMRADLNGLPYYMNHQVWRPDFNDPRGIGGDQIQMALSSWQLLYAYSGNERVKQNMKFLAEYYLSHSLSPENSVWANLPFPYNTLIYSGVYDGDMVMGRGYLQPDKAGSFGLELIHLYKMTTGDQFFHTTYARYLDGAKQIARTLLDHLKNGNDLESPLPYRVNAFTGEIGQFPISGAHGPVMIVQNYTTNWSATMELFLELEKLDPANAGEYRKGFEIFITWMKAYPLKTNRWGPFFEDVPGPADTQINAITFARFMLEHREYFANWRVEVPAIFDWVYRTLGNNKWQKYGVELVNEQSSYQMPGQSHVSRQGATELLYAALSGDSSRFVNATRQLTWATYMVDDDGKNRFIGDENWLTDGYGDYVRHYLRAMAAWPEIAPGNADHILSSTSVIQQSDYKGQINKFLVPYVRTEDLDKVHVFYRAFDDHGVEIIRLAQKPSAVLLNGRLVKEVKLSPEDGPIGYQWTDLKEGGVLKVVRKQGSEIVVIE